MVTILASGLTISLTYTEGLWWFLLLPTALSRAMDNYEADLLEADQQLAEKARDEEKNDTAATRAATQTASQTPRPSTGPGGHLNDRNQLWHPPRPTRTPQPAQTPNRPARRQASKRRHRHPLAHSGRRRAGRHAPRVPPAATVRPDARHLPRQRGPAREGARPDGRIRDRHRQQRRATTSARSAGSPAALRQFAPDVINCHDRSSLPYVVLANLFARRRPVVYTAHGLLFNADREPRRRHRLAMKGVTLATAVSEQVARRHADYLGWTGGFTVIPNGVPDVSVDDATRGGDLRSAARHRRAGDRLPGRRQRPTRKGLRGPARRDRVAASRPSPAADVRVLVAGKMGESPYCRDLLARPKRLGLESAVQFLGYRDDASRLYSAADVFVLSSRSEGLPMVLLEAMTAGLAVAATRVGGVPDATPEGTALLVDPAAPQELGQGDGRPGRRRRAAPPTRRRPRVRPPWPGYGVETMVSRYLDVYARAAAGKKRRRTATDAAGPGEIR